MTLIEARLLVGHPDLAVRRHGERARRAADRDLRAASRCVTASKTLTESLSWLTTHSRALPLARVSNAMLVETAGRVRGERQVHRLHEGLRLCGRPLSSITVTVT